MSRQDDQLQEKLQHIETELSAEAEKLSRVLAKIYRVKQNRGQLGIFSRCSLRQVGISEFGAEPPLRAVPGELGPVG